MPYILLVIVGKRHANRPNFIIIIARRDARVSFVCNNEFARVKTGGAGTASGEQKEIHQVYYFFDGV